MPRNTEAMQTTDGRHERSSSTRKQILAEGRALIIAGISDPTAKQISESAGITTRTLFRHFPDMATLLQTVMQQAQSQARAVMEEPFPNDLSPTEHWRELLQIVISRRTRAYESILPLHLSPTMQRHLATPKRNSLSKGINRRRARLKQILPEHLVENQLLFEALDATLSIEYWASLRVGQGLSIAKATKVLGFSIERLTIGH